MNMTAYYRFKSLIIDINAHEYYEYLITMYISKKYLKFQKKKHFFFQCQLFHEILKLI